MTQNTNIPLLESFDEFAFDHDEIRDLIQTTPLQYDHDGLPVGYDAEQLFGLEGAILGHRFIQPL